MGTTQNLRAVLAVLGLGALGLAGCGDEQPSSNPPTISVFRASKTTVAPGEKVTLTWEVTDATTISIDAAPGGEILDMDQRLTGSQETPAITANTTFTLTADGPGGSKTASVQVNLQAAADVTIDSFTVMPSSVRAGGMATLSWKVSNATSVKIDVQGGANVVPEGTAFESTQSVTANQTTIYVLTAAGPGGPKTAQATLTVDGTPVIVRFDAKAGQDRIIDRGESVDLAWEVTGATSVRLTDSANTVVYEGDQLVSERNVSPTATETYTLVASNAMGQSANAAVTITVNQPGGPRIIRFAAVPATPITEGASVALEWEVADVTSIQILEGATQLHTSTALSGSHTLTPAVGSHTYTLQTVTAAGNGPATTVTVVVNPAQVMNPPVIAAFGANPTDVAVGGTTTFSWTVTGATRLVLKRGAATEYETTNAAELASGTRMAAIATLGANTFTLEASNAQGTTTSSPVVVTAHTGPAIVAFTADPIAFAGSSTVVTVTWETTNATSVELNANGTAVAGFPTTSTTGTHQVMVNGLTTLELVARNMYGEARRSQTITPLVDEMEGTNNSSTTPSLIQPGTGVAGTADDEDEDWFAVDVAAGQSVRIEVNCTDDTLVRLHAPDGTLLGSDDDDGAGFCSVIDPVRDAFARELAAGRYLIRVSSFGSDDYQLIVTLIDPGCGNSIVESTETCDDGNAAAGDGCSPACVVEPAGVIQGPPSMDSFSASLAIGEVDTYVIELLSDGYITAETFAPTAPTCNADTVIRLYDDTGTSIDDDDDGGEGACSKLAPGGAADLRPAGRYTITVEEFGLNGALDYTLVVSTLAAGCGNGVLEMGESCDDGNPNQGDGCDANCNFEGAIESEPNNDSSTAPTISGFPSISSGAIDPADDVDFYRVDIEDGQSLIAYTTVGGLTTCDGLPSAVLTLYADDGVTELASDTFGGVDFNCGRLAPDTATVTLAMPAGTYYLAVSEDDGDDLIATYYLHVNVVDPGCGNTLLEASLGESCDDGNAVGGDGCSDMCQIEPIGTFNAPGAAATFTGAIVPATDIDYVRIDVAAGKDVYLSAETFTNAAMLECDSIDTVISLYDDAGAELGSDDEDGVDSCSKIKPSDTFARLEAGRTYWIRVEDFFNNNEIPAYEIVVSAEEADVCGNGLLEAGEQCDDGNGDNTDGCNTSCVVTPVATLAGPPADQTYTRSLAVGQKHYYRLDLSGDGYIRANVAIGGAGDCTATTGSDDTFFRLLDANFVELGNDEDDGLFSCSLIDPVDDEFAALSAGTYYFVIEESGNDAEIVDYELHLELLGLGCGNGITEASIDEECDDGGTADGDGCSATCKYERTAPISGTGGTVTVDLPENGFILVPVQVSDGQNVTVEIHDPGQPAGTCAFDVGANFGDSTLFLVGRAASATCPTIVPQTETWAGNLKAGEYFVVVFNNDVGVGGQMEVSVTIGSPVCNNSLVETLVGEACDDGNTSGGDGCSATCQPEAGTYVVETEDNGTAQSADSALTGPGTVTMVGSISSPFRTDVDHYSVVVPAGPSRTLSALTYDVLGDTTACSIDTWVQVLDAGGNVVAENNDIDDLFGPFCSEIAAVTLAPGTYSVVVRHGEGFLPTHLPLYYLDLALQ